MTPFKCFQTGPTMTSVADWGVNYRALNDLFNISQRRHSSVAYEIAVQMVEIYNEQVRDLLRNDSFQKRYPFQFSFLFACSRNSAFLLQFVNILRHYCTFFLLVQSMFPLTCAHTWDMEHFSTKRLSCARC